MLFVLFFLSLSICYSNQYFYNALREMLLPRANRNKTTGLKKWNIVDDFQFKRDSKYVTYCERAQHLRVKETLYYY